MRNSKNKLRQQTASLKERLSYWKAKFTDRSVSDAGKCPRCQADNVGVFSRLDPPVAQCLRCFASWSFEHTAATLEAKNKLEEVVREIALLAN